MSWLSGKPRRVISLHWPNDDPLIKRPDFLYRGTWSVLDDQVLRSFIIREPNEQSSEIYLAKLHEIVASGTTATFAKIATLPNAVHRVALLPDRLGFASLEFTKATSSITLRVHNWDGTISKERSSHAAAAYGSLVATRHVVAVCISSGQPSPEELCLAGNPSVYHRVDAYCGPEFNLPPDRILTGDHILVWMLDSDTVTSIQIPQDEEAPLTHDANFQFVGDSHLALGGIVISSFGTPSSLLKAFRVDNSDEFTRTFSHGPNFEPDDDIGCIAIPGSSGNNSVLANYHHAGSRFSVMDNGLLTRDINSEPSSDDPSGLHLVWDHPQVSRIIEGTFNRFIPSISDNRLLVGLRIDAEFNKFAVKGPSRFFSTIPFLYDFDQVRCRELYNLTATDRTSLESKLRAENENAQVSVVERNFTASIEDELDAEWGQETKVPQEWLAHLQKLHEIKTARMDGTEEAPILEFDEAPDAQKGNPRMLFTRSAVWLPEDTDIRAIEFDQMALTTSGIVHLPSSPGEVGHFFRFS